MPKSRPAKPSPIHLAVLAALSTPAWAQTPPPSTDKTQLETITVTAERRTEDIKDVPNSVTAIRGDLLETLNSGGQDVRMLAGRAPSLNIESSFGRAFPRFYIRGFGNTDFDLNASQPVSLVFDDVVQENPLLKGFPMFDIEQIEVIRGPQGTLFGRNSPAGVVKFDSVKPGRVAESYVAVGLGSFSTANLEGAINIPLGAASAVRLSAQIQHRDDWVDNTAPNRKSGELEGYDDNALRAQYLYAPDKSFSALFNIHGRKLEGTARLFRANIIQAGTNNLVDGFDEEKISIDGTNQQDLDSVGGSARLTWDWGPMALTSITGYESLDSFSRGDIDGGYGASFAPPSGPGFIPFPAESADGIPKLKQFTQEFRLESRTGGPLSWLAGAYFFREDVDIDSFNYDTLANGVQNGYAWQKQENTAWAFYGSANWALGNGLSVRGGLRYTKDEKEFSAQRTQSPIGAGPTGVLTANPSDNDTSGDLSVTYALDKDVNVYARYARGFRAPSVQGRLLFGDTISVAGSETVDSYEGGIKGDFWNKRARLSATVFSYEVKNQQLTAVGGATNFNTLINAAKSVGRGAELDFQAILTENLLVTLSASYNKTEIRDPNLRIAPCGGGCTVLDPSNGSTVSIDGNPLPNAPKNVYNFTLRYGIPMGNASELYFYTDWAYRSKINFFLYESVEFTGKALTEGGVRLGYRWDNGKYEAAVFGRNISNQIRVIGGIDFNNLTGMINEPRTYGVQFKALF